MFNHSSGVVVRGGTFTTHITNLALNENQEGLKLLQQSIASGAFHNSAERYDPPKCHPNTRVAILEKIMNWVEDPDKAALFLWMYGPAGAGKTAIAQTIAEICYDAGILAASFFFSRDAPSRNNQTCLITTLVYQLMLAIPEIRERVGKALETDPLLLSRSLAAQLRALVVIPLNAAALEEQGIQTLRSRPMFIILDGLDECGDPKTQRYILDIFVTAITQLTVPLFLLIACRPEAIIRDTFNEPFLSSSTIRIVLDDTYHPDADIRLFLKSRFQDIIRKHPRLQQLEPSWPSDVDIQRLVKKSSGQFIYASTAMKYLDVFTHWPPDRLDIIFGLSTSRDGTPFSELDIFYDHILSSVSRAEKVTEVLSFLMLVQFWKKTKTVIEDFLFLRRGEVDIILSDMHSLVSVPFSDHELDELRIFHASLPDFLLDRSRSGRFYIDKGEASTKLTLYCMIHFKLSSSLPTDGTNVHHLRSLFMVHCVSSNPTLALLDDLYDIDMSAQLDFWTSDDNIIGMYNHDAKRLITFVMWLREKKHPDREKDLFNHHLAAIDSWFRSQLDNYPHSYCLRQILAAGTLTKFMSQDIFSILGPISNSIVYKSRRSDPLQIYTPDAEYAEFYGIFCQFLADPLRSGKWCVDATGYATLAIFVSLFLQENWTGNRIEVDDVALNLLPIILKRAAKMQELGKVLQTHPLRTPSYRPSAEMSNAAKAIKEYVNGISIPDQLHLLVAYQKLREEKDINSDAYVIWMWQGHSDTYDRNERGYDIIVR